MFQVLQSMIIVTGAPMCVMIRILESDLIRSLRLAASKSLTEPSVILSSDGLLRFMALPIHIQITLMYLMLQKCRRMKCIEVQVYLIISVNSFKLPSVKRLDCSRQFSQHFCNNPSSINTPCFEVWVKKVRLSPFLSPRP
jgi:hypothetical protein